MATTFYLSSTATTPVTPGYAAWTRTSEADRREMHNVKTNSAFTNKSCWAGAAAAANDSCLNRQYVSKPMAAGIAFTIGDTIRIVARMYESATNDNIGREPICLKVYSEAGTVLRATLLPLLNYGTAAEWNTALRSQRATGAVSTAITAGYTTVAGDRLVLEIGGQTNLNVTGTSVTVYQNFGDTTASVALDYSDVDTGVDYPWFEISRTITFPQTYDETGKLQTILAVQARSDAQTMSEAARMQTVLVAQGRLDALSMLETDKTQTILAVQGELDGFLFNETGLTQIILALQGKSEQVILSEIGKLDLVLAVQGRSDTQSMIETGKAQVILAAQGRQDAMTLPELGREQVILVLQGRSDILVMDEAALQETIIVAQAETDGYFMGETGREEIILVVQSETDVYIPASGGVKNLYGGGFANANRFDHRGHI